MDKRVIGIRTEDELALMRKSGHISAVALKETINSAKPGVSLLELEKIATEKIIALGGIPAFKTVPGYAFTTCVTVNDEVVHGIPRDIVLKEGDILSIDLGAIYQGWYSDLAWSIVVGGGESSFLKAGEKALFAAIDQAKVGNRVGDISNALQKNIEKAGYSVVESLVGHGVGRDLHEAPEIPGIGTPGTGPVLKSGMTLAIEAIYTSGRPEVKLAEDGWTIVTADGSMGGLFEMDVIVGNEVEILADWRSV